MLRTTTFLPTHKGQLFQTVEYTGSGREVSTNPVPIRFSVVRIRYQTRTTSVRTDQSGSQGRAEQDVYDGRILLHPEVTPETGQQAVIDGHKFTIDEVQPRYDMAQNLNHWQVDLKL